MNTTQQLDWTAAAARATAMTTEGLEGAIQGILSDLDRADSMDREFGTCEGGLLRDELSVLRKEQNDRSRQWFKVTKRFTAGHLKGLTVTEKTTVQWRVGQVVAKPIGGDPYIIQAIELA